MVLIQETKSPTARLCLRQPLDILIGQINEWPLYNWNYQATLPKTQLNALARANEQGQLQINEQLQK